MTITCKPLLFVRRINDMAHRNLDANVRDIQMNTLSLLHSTICAYTYHSEIINSQNK